LEHQQTLLTQANYERELGDYTQLLLEKNRQMDALNQELLQSRQQAVLSADESQVLSAQLSNTSILTEADWRNFRQKFERVYPGFFDNLIKLVPDATEAEQRLMALTKLELGNDEIAAVLGILPESVTKTRYRLRKKLNDADLVAVVRGM
jgi:DNA-binding CsgD family transcriptional regulator